ncbi:MAG: hypothetical protein H0W70_09080, partial [Actinobacteria bacterium]|nr:hypothetical protein [Actinomycetota bacterium]
GNGVLVVLTLLAVAGAALFLWRALTHDTGSTDTTDPTSVTVTPGPTTAARAKNNAPKTTVGPSASAVSDAARRYVAFLSSGDYRSAYAMLSPGFRGAQSQAAFEAFWRSASPVSATGAPAVRGLSATVPLQMGGRANAYTLTFARGSDGGLYVDGPRPQ